jgi:hypothetical protein
VTATVLMPRAAGLGHVDGVFQEDRRVVVGEGHAAAAEGLGRARDRLGRGLVGQRVHLARLADGPVLTEAAGEIAAGGTEGEHGGTGQEVVQRLLLDRVHAEAARPAIRGEHDLVTFAGADEA